MKFDLSFFLWCASAACPLGGSCAPCLAFLQLCPPSPVPVLFSTSWPQTPSSSPGNEHTRHWCGTPDNTTTTQHKRHIGGNMRRSSTRLVKVLPASSLHPCRPHKPAQSLSFVSHPWRTQCLSLKVEDRLSAGGAVDTERRCDTWCKGCEAAAWFCTATAGSNTHVWRKQPGSHQSENAICLKRIFWLTFWLDVNCWIAILLRDYCGCMQLDTDLVTNSGTRLYKLGILTVTRHNIPTLSKSSHEVGRIAEAAWRRKG